MIRGSLDCIAIEVKVSRTKGGQGRGVEAGRRGDSGQREQDVAVVYVRYNDDGNECATSDWWSHTGCVYVRCQIDHTANSCCLSVVQ